MNIAKFHNVSRTLVKNTKDQPKVRKKNMKDVTDYIDTDSIDNLFQLFCERLNRSPASLAYKQYDESTGLWGNYSWADVADDIACWQAAFKSEQLIAGDAVAIMIRNCREWAIFDIAALSMGLVVIPLYTEDRPDNVSYILNDANVQLLLIDNDEQWNEFYKTLNNVTSLKRILSLSSMTGAPHDTRLRWISDWLPKDKCELKHSDIKSDALATVVYTSGTTGRPKGVMLSHRNILWNIKGALNSVTIYPSDRFVSFLPLCHTFERTVGYYLPICANASVSYARSIADLAEDMLTTKPTVMITVPRIFERIHNKIQEQLLGKSNTARNLFTDAVEIGYQQFLSKQKRGSWHASFLMLPILRKLVSKKILAKFGGSIRLCICGGAALSPQISRMFIGLGLPILQGYGLTEHSPIISVNRLQNNIPESVGIPLPGVEVKTSDVGELMVRGPSVMMGYLNNKNATDELIDHEGWLSTGDIVEIRDKHIFITGRLKEIIVMSNGEKVPPSDLEMAIQQDILIEQVMLIGEQRPYLTALIVANNDAWKQDPANENKDLFNIPVEKRNKIFLQQIKNRIKEFPGYAQIHNVALCQEPWSIENGMLTPTLKLRRKQINAKYASKIEEMYQGH